MQESIPRQLPIQVVQFVPLVELSSLPSALLILRHNVLEVGRQIIRCMLFQRVLLAADYPTLHALQRIPLTSPLPFPLPLIPVRLIAQFIVDVVDVVAVDMLPLSSLYDLMLYALA